MPSISYAITACNEDQELTRLLKLLRNNIRQEDEIVIQLDSNATSKVKTIARNYIEFPLNKDFASFKNNLKSNCKGDWIFQLDADEFIQEEFIQYLPEILQQNENIDVLLLPRINTVEGITQEHINKWKWQVNEEGWINFPDYQMRILKNIPSINWINKVHEVLTGFTEYSFFPPEDLYSLYHPKTIDRQEKQNNLYNTI
jgi:glycosyltransferase involved in cell wall biosynthesis